MSRRPRLFARGVLYHVIVRETQRQKTFLNDANYRAYLERLGRYRKKVCGILGLAFQSYRSWDEVIRV